MPNQPGPPPLLLLPALLLLPLLPSTAGVAAALPFKGAAAVGPRIAAGGAPGGGGGCLRTGMAPVPGGGGLAAAHDALVMVARARQPAHGRGESWVTCVLGLSLGDAVKSVNKNLDYKMLHAFGLR
jgi:hypothetical protein